MRPHHRLFSGLCAIVLLGGALSLRAAHRLDNAILAAARRHGVDHRLLFSVARRESSLRTDARGAAGEIGMFQIMPATVQDWAKTHRKNVPDERRLFRPEMNADIAAWYLGRGLERFGHRADPLPFALAYYNAGPSRAVVWDRDIPADANPIDLIPFPSTQAYVRDILRDYRGSLSP
jgi:soluble lytic murein transglycosylase